MNTIYSLKNKNILITGASSGIGYATAMLCDAAGANLVLGGRDEARLSATAEQLTRSPLALINKDITVGNDFFDDLGEHALDGVVLNAGISKQAPLIMLPDEYLDEILDTNLRAQIRLLRALAKRKLIRPHASIVMLSSIAAHTGTAGTLVYSASKGALEAASRVMALEFSKRHIRVNCVAPAMVKTAIYKENSEEWFAGHEARYPLGLGLPEDVANTILFLLADSAKFITGTRIVMDGGCVRV